MDTSEKAIAALTDPSAMRALAHPLRVRLLGELRVSGPQSVGMLAELFDEAPGSISYHVGVLARSGFVAEAPENARDGRERWWKAAQTHTRYEPSQLNSDPDTRVASAAMRHTFLQAQARELAEYIDLEPTLEPEWVAAATTGDTVAFLTPEELRDMADELNAFARKWESKSRPDAQGARPARFMYSAFVRPQYRKAATPEAEGETGSDQ
ncbi:DNA-binding transcriptional ArsR family regulator [Okibacterium sp. HSC-33S16]|uniref:ArsR/SmtB family transcription factor n=1 Tax=Okibacterium sp. HSC-33S16 TaxID=2910965 RepID=UPI00209E85BD|nr:helix-turn-helix domain-containing protein [Okibacterium sp. HSC-33S16]MCP2032049.1 DNA-binding transcriptional ArsR family regulator [Okibacterium sp. HSC-33S16]